MTHYILNEAGEPERCDDLMVWAQFFYDGDRRRVAYDERDGVGVSTVFLGLDHAYGGPPLVFETLILGGEDDGAMERYATRAEAEAGHAKWVVRLLR